MTVIQQVAQLMAPWADFYNASAVAQSAVNFGHFGGMMTAGGFALAADRSTLRAAASTDGPGRQLQELSAIHPIVVGALGVTAISGLLMFAADIESLVASAGLLAQDGAGGRAAAERVPDGAGPSAGWSWAIRRMPAAGAGSGSRRW